MEGRAVHLIGISGAGISSIARWYRSLGWEVSGCDAHPGGTAGDLRDEGIDVYEGHDPSHVESCQLVVFTAAVPLDHPELERARSLGIRVLRKSEALAELSHDRKLVAVAGAHGKTTTCGMIGWALERLDMSPTVFVGGKVLGWNSNFRGGSDPVIMEADEYDRAFLRLRPTIAVVTSFASEHLECYGDEGALAQAYAFFLEQTAPGGSVIVPDAHSMLAYWAGRLGRRVVTTGEGGDFDFRPGPVDGDWGAVYTTNLGLEGTLELPGRHNVLNASTACAALTQLGIDTESSLEAIASFPGVSRRLERIGSLGDNLVISDYAHHPEEIEASLRAIRTSRPGELLVVFEPHLYSRTARMGSDMAAALLTADTVMVLPVFAAREEPLPGVDNDLVCSAIREMGGEARTVTRDHLSAALDDAAPSSGGGTIVFMGAGDVDSLARSILGEVE